MPAGVPKCADICRSVLIELIDINMKGTAYERMMLMRKDDACTN
jgi:hypothetical protein